MIRLSRYKRKRGNLALCPSPLLAGLRIALIVGDGQRRSPRIGICLTSARDVIRIYNKPRQGIIYQPWTFTVVLSFDDFGKVAKFTSSQRQAFGKRPFHKDCTRHSAPCGASATECNCKYTAFISSRQMFWLLFVFLH